MLISVIPLFKCSVYVIRITPTYFSFLSFATNDLDNAVTMLLTLILAALVSPVPVQSV